MGSNVGVDDFSAAAQLRFSGQMPVFEAGGASLRLRHGCLFFVTLGCVVCTEHQRLQDSRLQREPKERGSIDSIDWCLDEVQRGFAVFAVPAFWGRQYLKSLFRSLVW